MNTQMIQHFSGAGAAKVTQKGHEYSVGTELGKGYSYTSRIIRNSVEETGTHGKLFVSKQEIISTNSPYDVPGDVRDYKVWFSQKSAFANIRGLIHALLGYDESRDKAILGGNGNVQMNIDKILNFAVDSSNPFEGIQVKVKTVLTQAKNIRPGASEPSKYAFFIWEPVVTPETPAVRDVVFKTLGI